MTVVFEDLNTYDGKHTVYPVVNESVHIWRDLLQQIPNVDSAASVSSGGEISFFAIAPKVRKRLDLIDHSYTSMYYAIGKYHLIDTLGSVAAFNALVEDNREVLRKAFEEGNKGLPTNPQPLPEAVKKYFKERAEYDAAWAEWDRKDREKHPFPRGVGYRDEDEWYYAQDARAREWVKKNPRPVPPKEFNAFGGYKESFDTRWRGATRCYQHIGQKPVTEFRAKRGITTFVHGDLNDIVERGPFDLVYLSNALSYQGRDRTKNYKVQEMVKPGGFIAFTGGDKPLSDYPFGYSTHPVKGCKLVASATRGTRPLTSFGNDWGYHLYQRPA